MTSHTNKYHYLINFDPVLGLDQYTLPGIQYIIM
jgi:hypothetical protein